MQYFEGEEADNDLTHRGAFPSSGCTQPLLMLVADEHVMDGGLALWSLVTENGDKATISFRKSSLLKASRRKPSSTFQQEVSHRTNIQASCGGENIIW